SAISCPSPYSQVGLRTSGTPRVNRKSQSFLYYPTRVSSSPSLACYYARSFLYRRQPLRSTCSWSGSTIRPRVRYLICLAAGDVDD
ncbi:hypothetical protein L209DRAFT_651549, partial [Thermothelomyces heterothallicus CBS 203.75]